MWIEESEKSFQELKRKLTTASILALLEYGVEFDVFAYVLHKGIRAILIQKGKVIACASRELKDFKCKYPTHDLKLVAVVFTLKIWRHKSLKCFFTQKKLNMRKRRWLESIKDYDCEIKYHPRKVNVVVDVLSQKAFMSHIIVQKELQQKILKEQIEVVIYALARMEIRSTLLDEIKKWSKK